MLPNACHLCNNKIGISRSGWFPFSKADLNVWKAYSFRRNLMYLIQQMHILFYLSHHCMDWLERVVRQCWENCCSNQETECFSELSWSLFVLSKIRRTSNYLHSSSCILIMFEYANKFQMKDIGLMKYSVECLIIENRAYDTISINQHKFILNLEDHFGKLITKEKIIKYLHCQCIF